MLDLRLQAEDQSNTVSLIVAVANYAGTYAVESAAAITTARQCLIDALTHGFEALRDPECAALISPLVPGAVMPGGARIPGTSLELDPAQAAFCTGLMLCRTADGSHWEALHSGCAPDPIAAILAVADYQGRKAAMEGKLPPKVRDVLGAILKALEVQRVLADEVAHQHMGVGAMTIRFARVAATAMATAQLGGSLEQIANALSCAVIDGDVLPPGQLPHDLQREDWARADSVSRAVRYACRAIAAHRASFLTRLDLNAADAAGKLLGVTPSTPKKTFGTDVIVRLADMRKPQHVAQFATRFQAAVERYFPPRQADRIKTLFAAPERFDDLPVNEFLAAVVTNGSSR